MNKKYVSLTLFSILLVSLISTDLSNRAYAASITLSPTSGLAGSTVTVTGSGFTAGSSIAILFEGVSVGAATADPNGSFTTTFTVPTDKQPGTYNVFATGGGISTFAPFTVTSPAVITLSPTSGPAGIPVTVSGSKFANNTSITIKFDNVTVTTNPAPLKSTSTGTFSATFTVPSTATAGSHTVTASDGTNTASAIFSVGALVTLSPTSGIVGTTVTVSGSSFGASKPITIKFDGATVTTNPATITTSSSGTFSASFVIPAGATAGSHTVSATDGTISGSAIFNVSSSATTTSLTPTSGAAGTSVTISGSGFTANGSVTIKFDTNTIATIPASITASASGTFSATITIPSTATAGNHTISSTDVAGKTASAIFKLIVPATITVSPTAGQRSTTVTVSGSNFNPSSTVTIKFDGTVLVTTPPAITTSSAGSFSTTVTIPSTASAGSHTISATDGAGKSASVTFNVSLGPVVILSPTSGVPGTEVTVTGSNFTKNTQATVKFGKITVPTEPSNLVIGITGTLAAKFLVPAGVAVGDHIVSVRDDTGRIGNATFTIKASLLTSISLSSTSGAPGATVTVTGSNFASTTSVTIKFDGSTITTVTTTATGTFSATFAIPSTAATGSHTISATDGTKSANATFNVTLQTLQTSISLSSTSAVAGSSVTVSGSGFAPGSTVTIRLDANVLATSVATSAGSFNAAINIPLTVTQGSHTISASDGTNSSSATLSITEEIREKVTLSNVKLVDQTGSSVSRPSEGMQILIQSDLKNNLASDQQFVYIVQVKDSRSVTVMISWMSGTLPAGKQYSVAQSWLAEEKGSYNVDVFVWQSISNPVVLAPASKTTINVS